MNHNFVFTISLKKNTYFSTLILVVFYKKVKIIQYLLRIIANFLFVFFSSYQVKKKTKTGHFRRNRWRLIVSCQWAIWTQLYFHVKFLFLRKFITSLALFNLFLRFFETYYFSLSIICTLIVDLHTYLSISK